MSSMRSMHFLGRAYLGLVFLFLYVPTLVVVVYSFNDSKLVSVWTGLSLRWYRALLSDQELLNAAWASIKVAVATAFSSMVVGAWAGFVLQRFRQFRGRTLFSGMINAPLVIPEVIQGISLLLLLVALQAALGWPTRGLVTVWIGHTMLCVSYVALTVYARLETVDEALHEAAAILGATPGRVFFDITLPLIAQALFSGWLLSFTISIDDVLMTAFLSGPDSTLLPILVFSRARIGLNPEINVLGTLFIAAVTAAVLAHSYAQARWPRAARRGRAAAAAPLGATA